MSVDVIMPQMGESIAEGTIVKWLKNVGDQVDRDEPLFEISTDKVDAEIPSPAAGKLLEILVDEGATVEINTVVGRIGEAGEAVKAAPSKPAPAPEPEAAPRAAPEAPAPAPAAPAAPAPKPSADAGRRVVRSSPVVQKIAAEHNVDVSLIEGTGEGGRVTKKDIMNYIASASTSGVPASAPTPAPQAPAAPQPAPAPSAAPAPRPAAPAPRPQVFAAGQDEVREPMSIMRKKIAEHMVISKALSPHVHTLYEVDMSRIDELRKAHRDEFIKASGGAKLSYTVFMVKAVVDALRATPVVNASVVGDEVIYHNDINVGLAVALEQGLIVPVIRRAQDLSMTGIARAIDDLAKRARDRKLDLSEIQGSSFSITNPGSFGGLIGFPVISQPNVAILGMGTVEKRVCVINDAIAIRPKMYMTLGYDHRLVDGATAEVFLSSVKRTLENFDETAL